MKEKVYADGQAVRENKAPTMPAADRGQLAVRLGTLLLWMLLGLLVPRACVTGGLAPFGISIAACVSGPGAAVVYLVTVVGYLFFSGVAFPLRYVIAVIAAGGLCWALSGLKRVTRHPLFAPLTAFFASSITGLIICVMGGNSLDAVLQVLGESLLAGGFAYFFKMTVSAFEEGQAPRTLSTVQQASVMMTAAVVLMAVSSIEFSGISPGRVLTVIAILMAARCAREQGGAIAGILFGVTVLLQDPTHAPMAVAYAFGGLLAGVFARFGRLSAAVAFVSVSAVISLSLGNVTQMVAGIYEVLAAGVLYIALPPVVDRKINGYFAKAQELPAVEGLRRSVDMRLRFASEAMTEVAGTVDIVSQKLAGLSAPDLGSVYCGVSEDICRGCHRRMRCWEKEFTDTMASFNDMSQTLRADGMVRREQVVGRLSVNCEHLEQVLRRVNTGYADYRLRESAWRRLTELRGVVTDQFCGMAELLAEISNDVGTVEKADVEAAERLRTVCEDYGLQVVETVVVVGRGNRVTAEVLVADSSTRALGGDWHKAVCNACGCTFERPMVTAVGELMKLRLTERPPFAVKLGKAQLNCAKERLCGDAVESFRDSRGRLSVVLSDGMGSGGRAAVDGAMTAGLTTRLLQAGFGADSALRMVNSALMVKSGDESLSTLDIACIDLFSGRIENHKAGAAPSWLLSRGRVTCVPNTSLPIGILREVNFENWEDTLCDGDVFLLVSDGVVAEGSDWVTDILRGFRPEQDDPQRLAQEIVCTARDRQGDSHQDDTTAVVMMMCRR